MNRKVSILIPAYNAEGSIAETLNSAVEQTWPNKEIIVVDDGSKDHTLAIARRFEHFGVRVVTQENQGASTARNTAYSLCQGDYVQWLDADDLLSPEKISAQVTALNQCTNKWLLASCGWGTFMHRHSRAKFIPTSLWCDLSPLEFMQRKMSENIFMQTSTWLVSRELCEAAGPWDTNLSADDDGEYFGRVLLNSSGIRFIPNGRVYYRQSGAQSLSYIGMSDSKMNAQFHSLCLQIRYLRLLENSDRSKAIGLILLQNWLPAFYPIRPDIVEHMHRLANRLGGHLQPPRVSWKYSWIKRLLGWNAARRAQLLLPRMKWLVVRAWDNLMFQIERDSLMRNPERQKSGKPGVRYSEFH